MNKKEILKSVLMKALSAIIFSTAVISVFVQKVVSQNGNRETATVSKVEAERWREDLRFMAQALPKTHKNLFHVITPEQFAANVKNLDGKIPSLARHQIIVEMARLVAMIGDGHTNIAPTRDAKIGFHTLPVKLYFFKDGLFIRAARRDYANFVGAKILKIGSLSVDEAYKRVGEIISRDNEMGVKYFAPSLLTMPEVLHALGVAENPQEIQLTVELAGKTQIVLFKEFVVAEMTPPDTDLSWMPKIDWIDLRDRNVSPTPLWLKADALDFKPQK